jgi:hypothetical protein
VLSGAANTMTIADLIGSLPGLFELIPQFQKDSKFRKEFRHLLFGFRLASRLPGIVVLSHTKLDACSTRMLEVSPVLITK